MVLINYITPYIIVPIMSSWTIPLYTKNPPCICVNETLNAIEQLLDAFCQKDVNQKALYDDVNKYFGIYAVYVYPLFVSSI